MRGSVLTGREWVVRADGLQFAEGSAWPKPILFRRVSHAFRVLRAQHPGPVGTAKNLPFDCGRISDGIAWLLKRESVCFGECMAGYWLAGLWTPTVIRYYLLVLPVTFLGVYLRRVVNHQLHGRAFFKYLYIGRA
jgi:hypothetical protein